MRRISVVDGDPHVGATRCLGKPLRPATLLDVIDQCLSEAKPHRDANTKAGMMAEALPR